LNQAPARKRKAELPSLQGETKHCVAVMSLLCADLIMLSISIKFDISTGTPHKMLSKIQ